MSSSGSKPIHYISDVAIQAHDKTMEPKVPVKIGKSRPVIVHGIQNQLKSGQSRITLDVKPKASTITPKTTINVPFQQNQPTQLPANSLQISHAPAPTYPPKPSIPIALIESEQPNSLALTGPSKPDQYLTNAYESKTDTYTQLQNTASDSPKSKQLVKLPRFQIISKKTAVIALATLIIISGLGTYATWFWRQNSSSETPGEVAGAIENISQEEQAKYDQWIFEKTGDIRPTTDDDDQDGLTNFEEFILGSNPTNAKTCSENTTDSENLLNLIDPVNCEPVNLESEDQFQKFNRVINVDKIREKFLSSLNGPLPDVDPTSENNSLSKLFNVDSLSSLNTISVESMEREVQSKQMKLEYLKTIEKIDEYVKKNRSYEPYDRDYAPPVHPGKFLEVSITYKVPLKYVLAIARTESRFGTDRYDANGNLTRPGEHKNIYSMGLNDRGDNLTYDNWDQGVEAFGKWYKKFHDRGVSDCRKWRIYNPNGNYCAKVEAIANEIDRFLKS